ncbi:MAG: hypothetical protein U1E65_21440 [Myxococcota bacterium]
MLRSIGAGSIALLLTAGCGGTAPSGTRLLAGGAIELGEAQAGEEVAFEIPSGTSGFSLTVEALDGGADTAIGVEELRDPSGAVLVRAFEDIAASNGPLLGPRGAGVGAVRVPLVDDRAGVPLPSGRWVVKPGGNVGGGKSGSAAAYGGRVRLSLRLAEAAASRVLDVDLYLPAGMSAAPGDAALGARLDIAFGLLDRLFSVGRGELRYHSIEARHAVLSSQTAIDEANRAADSVSAGAAAQIVLTQELSPDGGVLSGVSNCLPGAIGVLGTPCSAVIVALRSDEEPWMVGAAMAHELGHFMGLNHSTEFDGLADTLADTPSCSDTSKDGLARCPDRNNLMFPSVNTASGAEALWASPTQRAVVQSSPLLRAR